MDKNDTSVEKIFLQMNLAKSLQRDPDGNVIFTVEASNENLDFESQRVLQRALLQSKDYFLKNGIVSKDHKFREFNADGSYNINEDFIIGEPIDIFANGTSTMVKGKLYAKNEYAKKFIDLLDQNSSRVRASVGGLVPKVKNSIENGRKIGEIVSVLWDDLALTITPVNPTVAAATSMAKSLSSVEFVKALSAGYGADSSSFTGGRALQKEDVEDENVAVNDDVIQSLIGTIAKGDISDMDEAESYLIEHGFTKTDAREAVRAVCQKSNIFMEVFPMAKKSGWDEIKTMLKSLTGKKHEDDEDDDLLKDDSSTENEDGKDKDNEEDEYEDAGPVLKALGEKVESLQESLEIMAKSQAFLIEKLEQNKSMQKSLGQGIIAIMDRTEDVLASPAPRKAAVTQLEAAMAKAMSGKSAMPAGNVGGLKPFTNKTIDMAKDILTRAVADREIDLVTCGKFETQMNKSIGKASFTFSDDFVAFMQKKLSA